jgi:4a-hydroxytetrahydrobiopterin dehydratase
MTDRPLAPAEIEAALRPLAGWKFEHDALTKEFTFGSFREAVSFMVRVAFEAENLNHHPDWSNSYDRVAIRLQTHHAGNKVTPQDVALAQKIQSLSWVG